MVPTEKILHHADCPMTNERPEDRTICTCDAIEEAGFPGGERDTPQGGHQEWCSCYSRYRKRTGRPHVWNECDCVCHASKS